MGPAHGAEPGGTGKPHHPHLSRQCQHWQRGLIVVAVPSLPDRTGYQASHLLR